MGRKKEVKKPDKGGKTARSARPRRAFEIRKKPEEFFVVKLEDMTETGLAVGKLSGHFVVFVQGGIPGEKVRIRLTERRKTHGLGHVVEVLESSEDRIDPSCPHFPECGSCSWQMLRYSAQLKFKQQFVAKAFRDNGLPEDRINPIVGMTIPWYFRNRGIYPLKRVGDKVFMGFYMRGTHRIIDVRECPVQYPMLVKVANGFRKLVSEEPISIYNEERNWGKLRYFIVRGSKRLNEILVVLVTRMQAVSRKFAEKIAALDERIVGVAENINPHKTNVIYGLTTRKALGRDYYMERILDKSFRVSAPSFFQTNIDQAEKLIMEIRANMGRKYRLLVDAYSGVGLFSITLADMAEKVVGVEESISSHTDSLANRDINDQMNVEFVRGRAEDYLETSNPDVVIVDPPRKGLGDRGVSSVLAASPEVLFYISCNPFSFARDASVLIKNGYQLVFATPYDFFPQTHHVELLSKFVKAGRQ